MKSMAWCLCCKLICYLSVVYGKEGWGQLYAGMDRDGNDLETSCGIGVRMEIRVPGTVGDGYNICPLAAV